MAYEKYRIKSISQSGIWLMDKNGFQAEYVIPPDIDCSHLASGTDTEFDIQDGKIVGLKNSEEIKKITGYVGLIVEKAVQVDGILYTRNGLVLPEDVKTGFFVEATVQGDTLKSIHRTQAPEKPPEKKKGSGKIIVLTLEPPHLEYEYSYTPPGEEKKTNTSKYDLFSEKALEQLRAFKVGDWVSVRYSKKSGKFTLECIEKKVFPSKATIDPKITLESSLAGPAMQFFLFCKEHDISKAERDSDWKEYLNLIKTGVQLLGV